MIGVWIPGVEKPKRCEDCFALQGDECDCWCGLGVWDLQEVLLLWCRRGARWRSRGNSRD
jgi:hypothetical protein